MGICQHTMGLRHLFSQVPGVTIMAPRDKLIRKMMYTAVDCLKGPVFIRYPKAASRAQG